MVERTPADFSREFAGYMAEAAEEYIAAVDASCADPDNDTLAEDMGEFRQHLVSAIYEWRKRETVAHPIVPTQYSGNGAPE